MRKFLPFLLLLAGCEAFLYDSVQFTGLKPPAAFKLTLSSHSNALYANDHLVVRMTSTALSNFLYTTNNQHPTNSGYSLTGNELVYYRQPNFTLRIVGIKADGSYTAEVNSNIPAGNGTAGSPFAIATAVHLSNIRGMLSQPVHFRQIHSIDLAGIAWIPIGEQTTSFMGTYNGIGQDIENLKIDSTLDYTGLFGYCENATLSNIKIVNADVRSLAPYTAILCGFTSTVDIQNCHVSGILQTGGSSLNYAGGLVGHLQSGIVDGCTANVSLVAPAWDSVGGLMGHVSSNATIMNCTVTLPNGLSGRDNVGGLAGSIANTVRIFNSTVNSSSAYVSGRSNSGGFVGYANLTGIGALVNCDADIRVAGNDCVGGLVGQARGATIREGIARADQGTTVTATNTCAGGLVGTALAGSVISNSSAFPQVWCNSNTGGIAGLLDNSAIYGCYFQANVGSLNGGTAWNLGGLAGRQQNGGSVIHSQAYGSVSGSYYLGGLVGYAYGSGFVLSASASFANIMGGDYAGGLIGWRGSYVLVTDCRTSGTIVSGNNQLGGLIGYQTGPGTNQFCYIAAPFTAGSANLGWAIGQTDDIGTNSNIICRTNSGILVVGAGLTNGISGYAFSDTIPGNAYSLWNLSIWNLSDPQDPWLSWMPP